jgi:undecaprenyl-diphosphatase
MGTQNSFWKYLLIGFGLYSGFLIFAWIVSLFINDAVDQKILLFFNPDQRIYGIDEFFVGITDFSMILVGTCFAFWELGYIIFRKSSQGSIIAPRFLMIVGFIEGAVFFLGTWLFGYELVGIFPALSIITWILFYLLSRTYNTLAPEKLQMMQYVVGVTIIAALFSVIGEAIIKNIVHRPRPLNSENSDWNWAIRRFPDEIVIGLSYFSGHSSGLFAALTPFAWSLKSKSGRTVTWLWAGLHAFSRIYVAAHFPLCCLIGSLSGFCAGTICFWIFKNRK